MTEEDLVDKHVAQAVREFPSIDPEVEGIVARICKLNRYIEVALNQTLDDVELNVGDFRILVHLSNTGAPYEGLPSELADSLLVSSGSMTNRLDRLENRGLVERRADPKDRRSVVVRMTEKGRSLLDDAIAVQAKKEVDIVGPLEGVDRKALTDALRTLMLSAQERYGPAPRKKSFED